ncbi:MAG: 50S ribosomal protein L35 [Candidatus Shapirobacteria bacterium]
MKKNKKKIRKSVAKRFKVTKTGKVLRLSSFTGHLRRKKSSKQKRRLRKPKVVTGATAKKVKKMLGYK